MTLSGDLIAQLRHRLGEGDSAGRRRGLIVAATSEPLPPAYSIRLKLLLATFGYGRGQVRSASPVIARPYRFFAAFFFVVFFFAAFLREAAWMSRVLRTAAIHSGA